MTSSVAFSSILDLADESNEEAPPQSKGLAASVERHLREYFAAHESGLPAAGLYGRVLQEIERPLISVALVECQGNQLRAAELLGLNRNTLRKKIRDLGLEPRRGRRGLALHSSKKASNEQ